MTLGLDFREDISVAVVELRAAEKDVRKARLRPATRTR